MIRELQRNEVVKLKPDVPLIGGQTFIVEDKASVVFNDPMWMLLGLKGNPAVLQFVIAHKHDPKYDTNRDIYYGKVGGLGYLVRIDEVLDNEE